jgi:hypothetical protein
VLPGDPYHASVRRHFLSGVDPQQRGRAGEIAADS